MISMFVEVRVGGEGVGAWFVATSCKVHFFAAVAAEVDLETQQQMLTFEALLPHFRNAVRFLCTEAESARH